MIADFLDSTLLSPESLLESYDHCIDQALRQSCRGVVIPTSVIRDLGEELQRCRLKLTKFATVIGYPLGNEAI